MKKILFSFCEGPHYVAFITRVLLSDGYLYYNKTLGEFPNLVKNWLVTNAKQSSVEDLKIDAVTGNIRRFIPTSTLIKEEEEKLTMLFCFEGDSRKEARKKVLKDLKSWTKPISSEKEFYITEDYNCKFSVAYFLDADELGISDRLKEIREEVGEVLSIDNTEQFSDNGKRIQSKEGIDIGAYVFAGEDGKGTLEAIMLPLMQEQNESIFGDAKQYINKHIDDTRLKRMKIVKGEDGALTEKRDKKRKFKIIKSIIGIAGQLQNSGGSNVVCIQHSDYLNHSKVTGSNVCRSIIAFLAAL